MSDWSDEFEDEFGDTDDDDDAGSSSNNHNIPDPAQAAILNAAEMESIYRKLHRQFALSKDEIDTTYPTEAGVRAFYDECCKVTHAATDESDSDDDSDDEKWEDSKSKLTQDETADADFMQADAARIEKRRSASKVRRSVLVNKDAIAADQSNLKPEDQVSMSDIIAAQKALRADEDDEDSED